MEYIVHLGEHRISILIQFFVKLVNAYASWQYLFTPYEHFVPYSSIILSFYDDCVLCLR